ncbi:YfhJ family protein [Litchfieldia alkalitelluris]|uniref:YfhJ family protein n=1 Tax=Litchfieldia alkalitelluris TaxID=304268 RepID=UPI000996BD53|nr:YfhJ family protein [Litchfieldia alkalitelluris]
MDTIKEQLALLLVKKNQQLSYEKALSWVELLWDDFETTYAKAGHEYHGEKMTEKVVRQLIESYGSNLDHFIVKNPKYKDFLQ